MDEKKTEYKPNVVEILPQIVEENYEPHWTLNLAEEEYHADRTAASSSSIRLALESPRAFHRGFCMGLKKRETKAMNFGKAAHMAILEPARFKALYVVAPKFMGKTKEGKDSAQSGEARSKKMAWLAEQPAGALVMEQEDRDRLYWMIDALLSHPVACNLIKGAAFEQSGYFRDPETGIKCRIRPDILRTDLSALPDLKTTRSIKKQAFEREIWNYRLDVQMAFYYGGVYQIHGKRPDFPCIIAVENEQPHDVCVYALSDGLISRGEQAYMRSLKRIKKGIDTGLWPGHQPNGAEDVNLPAYTDGVIDCPEQEEEQYGSEVTAQG